METIKKYKIGLFSHLPEDALGNSGKTITSRLLLFFRSFRGFIIYALFVGDICIANAIIKHNYLHRYSFMKWRDMIINPYWTDTNFLRKGYASQVLKYIIDDQNESWKCLYAVVVNQNVASRRCLEKNGFEFVGYANRVLWTYHKTETKGQLMIYRYRKDV